MKVDSVFLKEVGGSQICPATEPPTSLNRALTSLKVAVVGVDRWRHGVVRVEDQTQSCGKELQIVTLEVVTAAHFSSGFRTQRALDDAHVDACFLKQSPA